jgi:hypothetical protein
VDGTWWGNLVKGMWSWFSLLFAYVLYYRGYASVFRVADLRGAAYAMKVQAPMFARMESYEDFVGRFEAEINLINELKTQDKEGMFLLPREAFLVVAGDTTATSERACMHIGIVCYCYLISTQIFILVCCVVNVHTTAYNGAWIVFAIGLQITRRANATRTCV